MPTWPPSIPCRADPVKSETTRAGSSKAAASLRRATEGPVWGYHVLVLGAISSFLEPFRGQLSPKVDKVSEKLTFEIPPRRALGGCPTWRPVSMLVRPGKSMYSLQEAGACSSVGRTLVRAHILLPQGVLDQLSPNGGAEPIAQWRPCEARPERETPMTCLTHLDRRLVSTTWE